MRKLAFETLEKKEMLASDVDNFVLPDGLNDVPACPMPIIAGAKVPLTALPLLSSNPNATAKLVLDFDGTFVASWGGKTNINNPVYDTDGDATTFSDQEIQNIRDIWARVAEDYAPFNIDVTTLDTGNLTDKVTAKVAIGGSYSTWYGQSAGGVAYIGGFYNGAPNVGFAFEDSLGNGNVKYTAEAISHEAGHLFGLNHQAQWNGTTFVTGYNPGANGWAPIMGVGYNQTLTTWFNGPTSLSSTSFQDDMSIISGMQNAFGYRVNPNGTMGTAKDLTSGSAVSGIIAQNTDKQFWKFTTSGGTVNLTVIGAGAAANFDSILDIYDSSGNVLFTANSTSTLNSSLNVNLSAGTYYAVVRSTGVYGRVGQYTLSGTFNVDTTAEPEVAVLLGNTNIADNGSVSFGSTTVGTIVDKIFTIRNDGTSLLTLQGVTNLPAGFTLLTDIGSSALQPGQTTTFAIRMNAVAAGSFSGVIRFNSNDADEGTYDVNISGTVTPPVVTGTPELTVLLDNKNFVSWATQAPFNVPFGSFVDKTFTIRNDGTGLLTLQPIDTTKFPAAYSVVENISATSLNPGETTTFTIRMNGTVVGSQYYTFNFLSNDKDESRFYVQLVGRVQPAATIRPALDVALVDLLMSEVGNNFFGRKR